LAGSVECLGYKISTYRKCQSERKIYWKASRREGNTKINLKEIRYGVCSGQNTFLEDT